MDYRIRYYFAVTPPDEFSAADGALVFEASCRSEDSTANPAGASCFDGVAASLDELVNRIEPVGRRLGVADETALCRHCYVLALFEEWYRAAVGPDSPLLGPGPDADPEAFLLLADAGALEDLSACRGPSSIPNGRCWPGQAC